MPSGGNGMNVAGVFLDRDGVINEEVDFLYRLDQLVLIPRSAEAIRKLNDARLPVVMVTNQSVVARNLCTEKDIHAIHQRLREMLDKQAGARLDAVYYCPHHPHPDVADPNPAYCIPCRCRKPGTAMLEQACADLTLEIRRCVLVGDTTQDIQTGRNAGCLTIGVRTGYGCNDGRFPVTPEYLVDDLMAAVDLILSRRAL
jgi:histidinol-phosphate phosphatase family protein